MKQDESYLIPFLSEKAEQCLSNQMITNSAFLDLHEKSQAAGLRLPHGVRRIFYGGFEGAERTVAVFLPDYIEAEDFASLSEFFILSPDDCPVAVLAYLDAECGCNKGRSGGYINGCVVVSSCSHDIAEIVVRRLELCCDLQQSGGGALNFKRRRILDFKRCQK